MFDMDFLICLAATVVLLLVAAVSLRAYRRRGKTVQLVGLALVPMGLWFTGLIGPLREAARPVIDWARTLTLTTPVWVGLGLLGGALLLWILGGLVAARTARRAVPAPGSPSAGAVTAGGGAGAGRTKTTSSGTTAPGAGRAPATRGQGAAADGRGGRQSSGQDAEMDEIEELLRKRGIE